jgi:hypothetical protein
MHDIGLAQNPVVRRSWQPRHCWVLRKAPETATVSSGAAPGRLPTITILLLSWFGA